MNPENFNTLIDMLAFRAENNPQKEAFSFDGKAISFGTLWQGINQFGSFLLEKGMQPGERVVVAVPNSAEFFPVFYGIQRAGGISVPVFPGAGIERIFSISSICGAKRIIIPPSVPVDQLASARQRASQGGLEVVTTRDGEGCSTQGKYPQVTGDDAAFLQYTSGSTGNPKGVILTHDNLLTNIRQMIAGMEITPEDNFVSWLPVYHDMGLILKTMVPFYLAAEVHLLPTNLRDVSPWLQAIQETRATFTAGPDFAYRLCLRHVDPGAYDLTSLRVALNAAEPVRASTIHEFEQAYRLEDVMVAGYGLAEATVGVSMWKPGTPNRVDLQGRVSVGAPFPGVEVRIWENDCMLPPGEVGEIAIRSKANTTGYYNNAEETNQLFTEDGYLLSGDLGYLDREGYLYIVSRKKNIIKRAGETISPQEIEEVVDAMAEVRFSAAIGIDKGDLQGEQVYIFAEIRDGDSFSGEELHEMAVGMVSAFHAHMGFRPAKITLLRPRSIPLTYNGKIQHNLLREKFLDGSLRTQGSILYPTY